MRILTRDEAEQWEGSPNLYLDDPPYLFEPGDLGYVPGDFTPRPPNPHPRPPLVRPEPYQPPRPIGPPTFFAQLTKTHPFSNPYTPMNIPGQMEFTFVVKLTANGEKFTTRPDFGPNWTQAELDQLVHAAFPEVTAEKCAAIGQRYFLELLGATTPRRCLSLFELLSVRPSSGGTATTPDGFHNAEDLRADLSLGLLPDVLHGWRSQIRIRKVGQEGAAIPVVDTVIDEATGAQNHYTALQNVRLVGEHLDFDRTIPAQGVFIAPAAGGPWVRLTTYGPATEMQIDVLIPAGIAGPQKLRVVNLREREGFSDVITP